MKLINSRAGFITLFFLMCCAVEAQDIPLGTWRSHVSFNDIQHIAISSNKIYAASTSGIEVLTLADNSITSFTKVNGLSDAGITALAFDPASNQLLIGYENGNLDILNSSGFTNYEELKEVSGVTVSKRINDIAIHNGLAYLATNYGVVVFDLSLREIKETFRDLGPLGERMEVYETTFYNDSVFLATETGVLAGDLDDNLLDFNNWVRFDTGDFNASTRSLEYFNNKVFAALDSKGIYSYENGTWTKASFLDGESFRKLQGSNNLYITTSTNHLFQLNSTGIISEITDALITQPILATDDNGKQYVCDGRNGLLIVSSGLVEKTNVNSPSFKVANRIHYVNAQHQILITSGGPDATYLPRGNVEKLNAFSSGNWSSFEGYVENDLSDVAVVGSKLYLASYGYGLQVIDGTVSMIYNNTNSPLQNLSPGNNVWVSALAPATDGVWVANYGASQPLHFLHTGNTWDSYSFSGIGKYITALETDYLGNVWMILNPSQGGGILVLNKENGQTVYLSEATNQGALPSRNVYAISADRSGQMWIGTAQGVAYFSDPGRVFSGSVNSIRPIVEGRYLLRDDKVTSIAVDGGNRKWFGTERGAWLIDATGEKAIHYFSIDNSPLFSNTIIDIEVQPVTGEVFISTDHGILSYRSDATESSPTFGEIKIFPNPVAATFNGLVAISGLATDASVKITDIAGKLVWQGTANGGTASWNVQDYNGRRPSTGVYLVLSTSVDGTSGIVGKIAIVN